MIQPNISPDADRWVWLKRLNASMSAWAAGLSWWRMVLLALIALIAFNAITENLQLRHQTISVPRKVVKASPKPPVPTGSQESAPKPCQPKRILIHGKPVVVITEAGCIPDAPASAASDAAPGKASDTDAAIKIEIPAAANDSEVADPADNESDYETQYTFGGWIKDVSAALLIAFFSYLAAAKIIVRKTAESDAKVQQANDSAEREAMQRQLVQARLKLLQAQVEPHFLFNTLAAVDYLIETDPKRASEMQKLLIGYLRAALPQMREESSTLGRELALIRPYLELLQLRIEDRMSYDIQVPPGLASTVFPPMVLQTLVENAIKHGIEPKPEGGKVTVSAQVVDGHLQVQVIDTGVGLGAGNIYAANTQGTGLGLDNIRNRLALLYPGASSLELRPGEPCGTVATLTIPYQSEKFKAV